MKRITRILCVLLTLCMLVALVSCGKVKLPELQPEVDMAEYLETSGKLLDEALGEFMTALQAANSEKDDVDLRYALMAIAEAKLLESGVYVPGSSNGGNYAISRVAPNTTDYALWGLDSYRYQTALVCTDFIKKADRAELKAKYADLKGTGTYYEEAKKFLTEKGYQLTDSYSYSFSSDPETWDLLATYRSADSEQIIHTMNFLIEYDCEGTMQPSLATALPTVSEDGLTYTFTIRQGVEWTDSQGRKVGDLTAEDFVTGLQHLLDVSGGLETLAYVIEGAEGYVKGDITDFSKVGVKAIDAYTLQYKLTEKCPYFVSMFSYNPFAPLCKTYYESLGGKFGADFADDDESYKYGKDPSSIAYCGPYLIKNFTSESTISYVLNENYWNKENVTIKKLTALFNDGSEELKAYNDALKGTLSGAGLNATALQKAKEDGNFEKYGYVSATDATSFGTFVNLNRRFYSNVNDATKVVTSISAEDAANSNTALQNQHFRLALAMAVDKADYNGQSVGDELALFSVINSYTPGNFVRLSKDVTVKINGTDTTFKAGTFYGAIMQAQINADGIKIKVWDPEAEGGLGSSAGFDGWYNVENAKEQFNKAIEELAADGLTIDKKHPIYLDLPMYSASTTYVNRANSLKQSIEGAFDGLVKVNLTDCSTALDWYFAGYYCDYGYQCNYNLYDVSGWGPDFGDPCSYLNTLGSDEGDMIHCLGIY